MSSLLTPLPAATMNDHNLHRQPSRLPIILATSISLTLLITLLFGLTLFLYRRFSKNRTAPSENPQTQNIPHRFSYSLLRRSTASFSPSNRLGRGGFGSVYKATLPSRISLAVKVMESPGSLQGEREFHNELTVCSSLNNPNTISLLGFSSDKHRRRLLLVYELMPNRSLQDALFDKKSPELMDWKKRFDIAGNVASGLNYLHHYCSPPVIHGDIKPSNILLDSEFLAKIGDFGLARFKTEDGVVEEEDEEKAKKEAMDDNGSILEETESVLTAAFEENGTESCALKIFSTEELPETDKVSVESGRDLAGVKKGGSGRDWWWKQDNGVDGSESGRVKDYVMEWIGSEIKKERPKTEWIASPSMNSSKVEPKKHKKRLDWWASLDEERNTKKEKARKPREWWKEEFCEELTKKKKKRELNSDVGQDRKRKKSRSSKGSIDWWLDGFSGELIRNGRRNHHNQEWISADIPKSGGISSTPSMRGTVCYIAPECGGGGNLSEKCDVYSFGVLLLVLVSGRRPLQVMASPMSEFERANLISWARQLARNGKLLDLVDPSIHSLDKEQALLCITIALLCLQRSPIKRPTMQEIVAVLAGEAEPPHLPFEFSPSPPSNSVFKQQKKSRQS